MIYDFCEVCNGKTYHMETELEKKDGSFVEVLECEECETTTNL